MRASIRTYIHRFAYIARAPYFGKLFLLDFRLIFLFEMFGNVVDCSLCLLAKRMWIVCVGDD